MSFTRTKIICTVGPATKSIAILRKLHAEGMNIVRINMSHANHKSALSTITKVKKINSDLKDGATPIAVLLDTQGPEIRTGDTSIPLDLATGDEVTLTVRDQVDVETSSIQINYKDLREPLAGNEIINITKEGIKNYKQYNLREYEWRRSRRYP